MGEVVKMLKAALKGFAILMTLLFFFLWTSGILRDVYLMLSVPDDETASIFMMDTDGMNIVSEP